MDGELKYVEAYDIQDDMWHYIAYEGDKSTHFKLESREGLPAMLDKIKKWYDSPNFPGAP